MLFRIKTILPIMILFAMILTFTSPGLHSSDSRTSRYSAKNKMEKLSETNYIKKDAQLTTEINLTPFIRQLQNELQQVDNVNDIKKIKKNYPEIISISKKRISGPFTWIDLSLYHSPHYSLDIENHEARAIIPVLKKLTPVEYQIKLKTNIAGEIEKKQQVRMYTVTHLQNNRWKTIPTKYSPKKSLKYGIESKLPTLQPDGEDKGISHYIQNELVIKFKPNVSEKDIQNFIKQNNLSIQKRRDHTIIVTSPNQNTKNLLKKIEQMKDHSIQYVEPHFIYLTNEVNDRLYLDYQWNLPVIFTEQGWELTKGKENVVIAVIDTGVDLDHPEFKGKLVDGINIIDPSLLPMDDDGHGTHIAGIISANTNNNEGIAGITWYNKIMPIKVLDQSGAGTLFDVAEGIFWAADHGAKVINLSLGNYAESEYLHDAIKYAYSKDIVLVAAAGNDNIEDLGYPASYPEVMGIAALDSYQQKAEFSNYGPYIDVAAPGVNIASTFPGEQYAALSGTSMASPHVAGLAGLIRSMNPKLSNEEVANIIKETATDLGTAGKDPYYGYGEINIAKAIEKSNQGKQTYSIFFKWIQRLIK